MTNEMIMAVVLSFLFLGTVISGILLSIEQHKNLTREEQYAKSRDEIARHMDVFGVSDAKEGSEWKEIHVYTHEQLGLSEH